MLRSRVLQEVIDTTRSVISITRTLFIRKQLLDGPITTRRSELQPEERALNHAITHLRHSLGQRTQFRVVFDVLTRRSGRTVYKRLRKQSVFINVGDPEQAELAIEAILSFAQSLDGKWLAPAETRQSSQTTDSEMLRYYSPDRQETSSQSAEDSQGKSAEPAAPEPGEEPSGLTSQQDAGK